MINERSLVADDSSEHGSRLTDVGTIDSNTLICILLEYFPLVARHDSMKV